MLSAVFSQLGIMLLMVGTGYLLQRRGVVSDRFQSDLSALILWVALPCSIVESGLLDMEQGLSPLLVTTGLSALCYFFTIFLAEGSSRILHISPPHSGMFCCMIVFANTAFIGFPLCSLLLGNKGVFYCSLFNMVFTFFFFTYGVRKLGSRQKGGVAKAFMDDPGLIATFVMLLLFLLQWKPPAFLRTFLSGMSALCTPLSMLVIGGMLTKVDLRGVFKQKYYYAITLMRLLIIPLSALMLSLPLAALGLDKDILFVVIIMCALPAGSLTAIYSQTYGRSATFVSGGIIHTMLCFCITLPCILLLAKWALYGRI